MTEIPIRRIQSAPGAQPTLGRFNIRDVKTLLDGRDMLHELHRHNFYYLLAIQKGAGVHEIDFIKYPVKDYSLFFLRPGQVHRLELKAKSTGFLIGFDQAFYQPKGRITDQRWKKASGKNYCKVEGAGFMKLHALLETMYYEFTTRQEGYEEAIKAIFDLFLIEYVRQNHNPQKSNKDETGYSQERFEELMHLLETNITSKKTVSQYTELLNLSAYQLNAITKAYAGKTVSELINEQIILESKRFLLATSDQVKNIADQLGYEDVSYFIRFFKKHTGLSPEAFRKSFK